MRKIVLIERFGQHTKTVFQTIRLKSQMTLIYLLSLLLLRLQKALLKMVWPPWLIQLIRQLDVWRSKWCVKIQVYQRQQQNRRHHRPYQHHQPTDLTIMLKLLNHFKSTSTFVNRNLKGKAFLCVAIRTNYCKYINLEIHYEAIFNNHSL